MFISLNSTKLSGNKTGFTLLEILIAVFILVVVMTTVYAAYRGTFNIIQESEEESEIYSIARTTMQRMLKDFSSLAANGGKLTFISRSSKGAGTGVNFVDLTFISNAHLAFSDDAVSSGLAEITYYLEEDPSGEGYRLMRTDVITAEVEKGEESQDGFVLAKKIQSLRYAFFDNQGTQYDSWDSSASVAGQINKAPAMVAVELKLMNDRDKDHPYAFATKFLMPVSYTGSPGR